jgi:hypothetical protein
VAELKINPDFFVLISQRKEENKSPPHPPSLTFLKGITLVSGPKIRLLIKRNGNRQRKIG